MDPRLAWLRDNGFAWSLLNAASSRLFKEEVTENDKKDDEDDGTISDEFQSSGNEPRDLTEDSAGCYLCTQCGKAFDTENRLEHHVITVHEIADQTDNLSTFEDSLSSPIKSDRSQHRYACKLCPRTFTVSSALNVHYTHTHKDKPQYDCEMCGRAFTVKRELATHRRMHDGQPTHRCRQCGKEFGTKQLLRKHELWHTGERAHVCPQCGKAFFQKGHLTQHLLIHAGGRPHICVLCGKTFIFKFDLNRHMKIHAERIIVAAGGGTGGVTADDAAKSADLESTINAFLNETNCGRTSPDDVVNTADESVVTRGSRIISASPSGDMAESHDCHGEDSTISTDVSPVNSVSSTSAGSSPCCDQCVSYRSDLDVSQRRTKDLQVLLEQRNQELEALKSKIVSVGDVTGHLLETCSDFDKFWMLHSKKIYSQIQSVLNALQ